MRTVGALLALLLPATAVAQVITDMTPDRVREAIAVGAADAGKDFEAGCRFLKNGTHFYGCFSTPFMRVVALSSTAAKKYERLSEADVPANILAPEVWIQAHPGKGDYSLLVSPQAVVITPRKSADPADAVKPTRLTEDVSEYSNSMGAKRTGKTLVATFPLGVLSEDNVVHFVLDGTKGGCTDCAVPFKLKGIR